MKYGRRAADPVASAASTPVAHLGGPALGIAGAGGGPSAQDSSQAWNTAIPCSPARSCASSAERRDDVRLTAELVHDRSAEERVDQG